MKFYVRYVILMIFIAIHMLGFSQNQESISNIAIHDLQPMSNRRWAVASRELPSRPNSLDTFSIRIIDSSGLTLKKIFINSPLGNWGHELGQLFVFPNGELLISYGQGECDF